MVEGTGGEPRQRGHPLCHIAEESDPRRRADSPTDCYPDATGALVGLVVLNLGYSTIGRLGFLRYGIGLAFDRWSFLSG